MSRKFNISTFQNYKKIPQKQFDHVLSLIFVQLAEYFIQLAEVMPSFEVAKVAKQTRQFTTVLLSVTFLWCSHETKNSMDASRQRPVIMAQFINLSKTYSQTRNFPSLVLVPLRAPDNNIKVSNYPAGRRM